MNENSEEKTQTAESDRCARTAEPHDQTQAAGRESSSVPDPRVRTARPTDAEQIQSLQTHLRQPNPDLLEYALAIGSVRVSVADDRPVGYLLPVDAADQPGVYLAELAVDPAFRREGRARGLLASVLAETTGPATLQAHPDNVGAIELYEELGFTAVNRRPDAYDDCDAIVFRRV